MNCILCGSIMTSDTPISLACNNGHGRLVFSRSTGRYITPDSDVAEKCRSKGYTVRKDGDYWVIIR